MTILSEKPANQEQSGIICIYPASDFVNHLQLRKNNPEVVFGSKNYRLKYFF
jgi:hypothetical protein